MATTQLNGLLWELTGYYPAELDNADWRELYEVREMALVEAADAADAAVAQAYRDLAKLARAYMEVRYGTQC